MKLMLVLPLLALVTLSLSLNLRPGNLKQRSDEMKKGKSGEYRFEILIFIYHYLSEKSQEHRGPRRDPVSELSRSLSSRPRQGNHNQSRNILSPQLLFCVLRPGTQRWPRVRGLFSPSRPLIQRPPTPVAMTMFKYLMDLSSRNTVAPTSQLPSSVQETR